MNVQRGKLVAGGRLQLPVEIRRELSLSDGDTVLIEVVDREIHMRPYWDALWPIGQATATWELMLEEWLSRSEPLRNEPWLLILAEQRRTAVVH